ncbi:hypothetical protein [Mycobacterium sp. ITM-2016-00318]|uniref:hypothetical protein n=1 Tax=Mycobacterium sp. ITM-2016-00318 TaxID=2099693 RepID=UPI000CFA09A4|nr:hypothetical protein [Mycobacterium sp. ITM-2016-00318]WNG90926.1 hypothetical protein C6A82_015425 [Mycobacterium sp. ITM-2016-00318]
MKNHIRILLLGVIALLAFGALSACSSGTKEATETSGTTESAKSPQASGTSATPAPATASPFPQSAKYIADTKSPDGKPMVIGIAVDGTEIAAYACNGTDDEAWFFGNQKDGKIDITSRFKDTLRAEFDGKDVVGDLTMNGVAFKFSAPAVPAPAGMYTAVLNGVRASWVVRPDGSATGVQFNGGISGRDFEQAELQQLNEQQFRNSVRNKRQLQQAEQITQLANQSARSTINGTEVTPVVVNGNFRL